MTDRPHRRSGRKKRLSKHGAESITPDRSTTGIRKKEQERNGTTVTYRVRPAGHRTGRSPSRLIAGCAPSTPGARNRPRDVRASVSSPPAVHRTPPPVTGRRHEDRAMTLRSEHHIRRGLPSGPVPGRAGGPSPAGPAASRPRRGDDAQMVRPAPRLVLSGATPAKGPHAPPPVTWAAAPPGGAGTTPNRSFFAEIAMSIDDGRSNDDSKSAGTAPVG